uniref:Uncharacterized protein n=1 Tax=Setaria digitata TaxID=48799 RepID=A0A915Q6B3_9BILA
MITVYLGYLRDVVEYLTVQSCSINSYRARESWCKAIANFETCSGVRASSTAHHINNRRSGHSPPSTTLSVTDLWLYLKR